MKLFVKLGKHCLTSVLIVGVSLSSVFANQYGLKKQDSLMGERWQFRGFGTLGYAQTDKYNDTFFRRDISQDAVRVRDDPFLLDSRIGLQVTGELTDHWEVVLQSVLKQKIDAELSDYINIAFARYTTATNWQLTLGRQPFDLFLMSENRNVGYSYDWIRPPIEFYGALPSDSFDGIKIAKTWGGFDHDWYWHASVGKMDEGFQLSVPTDANPFPQELGPISEIRGVESTKIEPIYTTGVTWTSNNWQLHGGVSWLEIEQQLDFANDFSLLVDLFSSLWPDLVNISDQLLGKNQIRHFALGAKWESGPWKLQSEVSHVDSDRASYKGQRGYLSLSRRYDEWLGYAVLGYANDGSSIEYQAVSELDLPSDSLTQAVLFATQYEIDNRLAALKQNQTSLTLGVRWDFASEKAVKVQCENYWFEGGSNALIDRINGNYLKDQSQAWCSFAFDWVF